MRINKKNGLIVLLVVLLIAGISVRSCKYTQKKLPTETITVSKGNIDDKVIAVGNIIPKHTVNVKSTSPGIVGTIFHEEGDYVEPGTLLLQVLPAPTPQSVADAYALVKENVAIVKQAEDHKKRIEKLIHLNLDTRDNYAITIKDLATAKARLEVAQQKLALLQKGETKIAGQNINTTIVSPIAGYILTRNVDVGEPVVPLTEAQDGTILFTIADLQDLIFKGTVNEIDVSKIAPQMLANISVGALPDIKIQGTLNKVGLQANGVDAKNTRTKDDAGSPFNIGFNVELNHLKLPKNLKLRAGYSATAEITVKHLQQALIIPERILKFKDNKILVSLFDKKSQQAQEQEITIGISDGINVEVLTGLKAGDVLLDNSATTT